MLNILKKACLAIQGRKTTIATILAAVIMVLRVFNVVNNEQALALNGLLIALGLGANIVNSYNK